MNENNIDFGIRCDAAITELNRCAWSVKIINLFEAFEDVGLDNIPAIINTLQPQKAHEIRCACFHPHICAILHLDNAGFVRVQR